MSDATKSDVNSNESLSKRYVIIDTDAGTDDAWALFMIIKAEERFNIKVLAISCCHGNTTVDNVARNVIRILECIGRLDIPVYKGAAEPLIPPTELPLSVEPFHRSDGLGNVHKTEPNLSVLRTENAVSALNYWTTKYPKQISLIGLGPLTNIALAIKTYHNFRHNVKDIFIMGGNYHGIGNISKCAEFNFFTDPESAFIVLNIGTCPITVIPWETCLSENLQISIQWRFDTLGNLPNNKIIDLMNPVDHSCYVNRNYESWIPCDALVTAVFIHPERIVKRKKRCHATVELTGTHTRGQMVIDHLNNTVENITLIELIHSVECKECFLWIVDHPEHRF